VKIKDGFTTNNVENFFGTFKRGMRGTYHAANNTCSVT
jgi:hypothetical protein